MIFNEPQELFRLKPSLQRGLFGRGGIIIVAGGKLFYTELFTSGDLTGLRYERVIQPYGTALS